MSLPSRRPSTFPIDSIARSVAISLGREGETEALKHALAMGVDSAVAGG